MTNVQTNIAYIKWNWCVNINIDKNLVSSTYCGFIILKLMVSMKKMRIYCNRQNYMLLGNEQHKSSYGFKLFKMYINTQRNCIFFNINTQMFMYYKLFCGWHQIEIVYKNQINLWIISFDKELHGSEMGLIPKSICTKKKNNINT